MRISGLGFGFSFAGFTLHLFSGLVRDSWSWVSDFRCLFAVSVYEVKVEIWGFWFRFLAFDDGDWVVFLFWASVPNVAPSNSGQFCM